MATNTRTHEALLRAQSSRSTMNYSPILEGFAAKGIPMSEILPRENVLTFWAWKELGRRVKKGEHGVKCTTFILASKKDAETGEVKSGPFKVPHTVTVFHVSQTEPDTPQKGD